VLVLLPNCTEFALCFLALSAIGASAVLLDPKSKEHELASAVEDCRPRAAIADPEALERCRAVAAGYGRQVFFVSSGAETPDAIALRSLQRGTSRPPLGGPSADQPLLYQYSSGSTGRPKRVERTQAQCCAEARLLRDTLGLSADDTILCAVPLFHAYGLGDCLLASVGSGAKLVIQKQPQPFAVQRRRTLDLLVAEGVTVFPIVPFMAELLAGLRDSADLSGLRYCFSAGNALPHAVFSAFDQKFGVPVRQLYGCTEAPSITVNLDADPRPTAGSVGRPMRGVAIRVQDEHGNPLPPGHVGEVGVKSPAAATGYVGENVQDPWTFREGWVFPGDLGSIDEEGRLTIAGRTRIFIEVAGHKVDPIEVEDVLRRHPAVQDAVVVGARQEHARGELVKAAVVARGPCSEQDLIRFCGERLAPFKVPQIVDFRDSIPRSSLGKVLRKELV
jgi:long-chain acyl-CoA synthetase